MENPTFHLEGVVRERDSLADFEGPLSLILMLPSKDKIVMTVKNGRESLKVLLEAGNIGRVHITEQKFENPDVPPMFCMLLRKHLTGAKILAVEQPEMERIVRLELEGRDELGERCRRALVLEAIGRQANLILLDTDGRIVDCLFKIG